MTSVLSLRRFTLAVLIACSTLVTSSGFAQATRTWVSGVGDDANPCSRTAPGKTFAGAISKTADGGQISVLDPGGFGAVTITKSMTIDGSNTMASILAAGTTGVTINSGTATVILRGLDINGAGSGIRGINIVAAKSVLIEDCNIYGFTQSGVTVASGTAPVEVLINKTSIRNCQGGAVVASGSSGNLLLGVTGSQLSASSFGVRASGNVFGTIQNTFIASNSGAAVEAQVDARLKVLDSTLSQNGSGIVAAGVVLLSNSKIVESAGPGLSITGDGKVRSTGDNVLQANNPNGVPTGVIPLN